MKIKKVDNIWCGFKLTVWEQIEVTRLTLLEFKKAVHKRRRPFQIVEQAKGIKMPHEVYLKKNQ